MPRQNTDRAAWSVYNRIVVSMVIIKVKTHVMETEMVI